MENSDIGKFVLTICGILCLTFVGAYLVVGFDTGSAHAQTATHQVGSMPKVIYPATHH